MSRSAETVSWVYYGDEVHPVHRGFQESIGADSFSVPKIELKGITGTAPQNVLGALMADIPEYGVYVIERVNVLPTAPLISYTYPDAKVVLLAADPRVCEFTNYEYSTDGSILRRVRRINQYTNLMCTRYIIRNYIDGIVSVSELFDSEMRSVAPGVPTEVVTPYIRPEIEDSLEALSPSLDEKTAVTICGGRYHKGVDLLVDAWPIVRETHPTAELSVVGKGHPEAYEDVPGVTVCGYLETDEFLETLSRTSLYVHPAIVDAFGVSVLEAMRAGVPCIVTRNTGARSAVEAVDRRLLTDCDHVSIADNVSQYFSLRSSIRETYSREFREVSRSYTEDAKLTEFAAKMTELCRTIS